MKKVIYANYDKDGVTVYQAFKPETVEAAVEKGTFGKGFGFERTSWIKPSFAWTLRRSKYATKHRMQAIAKIKIKHDSFIEILQMSVESHYNSTLYQDEMEWKNALRLSTVVHQWDPERDLSGRRMERQAIQIGLSGDTLRKYVEDYIIEVQDVTDLAHAIGSAVKGKGAQLPEVPIEKEYEIDEDIFTKLGCER